MSGFHRLCWVAFPYAYGKPKERVEVDSKIDVLRFVITNQAEPPLTPQRSAEDQVER